MTEKRFTTTGYKIYDTFHDGMHWLVNEVEAEEIVTVMNNLDTKARERSKALSKLQKENEQLEEAREYYQENFLTMKTERNQFKRENEQLKSFIKKLTNHNGEILLMNGYGYTKSYVERLLE